MGRWLKKVAGKAGKVVEKIGDKIEEHASVLTDAAKEIKQQGRECATLSRETVDICQETAQARQEMVDFATNIHNVIGKLSGSSSRGEGEEETSATILESIKDLTDGDNIRAAKKLAERMNDAALMCVDKSVKMVDLMESGMDRLPDIVQTAILEGVGEHDDEPDENDLATLKTIDRDIEDVQTCVKAIKKLNLRTALVVGLQAFTALSEKARISQVMFDSMRGFAGDVSDLCTALKEMDVRTVVKCGRDLLRCIRLSETVKLIALGVKKLIQAIIELFEMTSDRISKLFKALAFAKDCMIESLELVKVAKEVTVDAATKSTALITKSRSVRDQLKEVGAVNRSSIRAIKDLVKSGEIQDAIDLARNMDDMVLECSTKVIHMVNRVCEGFKNMPDILMEGVDVEKEGKDEDDPPPADAQADIEEIEESNRGIEEADATATTRAGATGFALVSEKSNKCKGMLESIKNFAMNCDSTILAFTTNWNLDSAAQKISEMCRLVNLGEMIKQFAGQIKGLLMVIVALMTCAVQKFTKLDIKDLAGDVVDEVGDAVGDAVGKLGKLRGKVKRKLKGRKKLFKGKLLKGTLRLRK